MAIFSANVQLHCKIALPAQEHWTFRVTRWTSTPALCQNKKCRTQWFRKHQKMIHGFGDDPCSNWGGRDSNAAKSIIGALSKFKNILIIKNPIQSWPLHNQNHGTRTYCHRVVGLFYWTYMYCLAHRKNSLLSCFSKHYFLTRTLVFQNITFLYFSRHRVGLFSKRYLHCRVVIIFPNNLFLKICNDQLNLTCHKTLKC